MSLDSVPSSSSGSALEGQLFSQHFEGDASPFERVFPTSVFLLSQGLFQDSASERTWESRILTTVVGHRLSRMEKANSYKILQRTLPGLEWQGRRHLRVEGLW